MTDLGVVEAALRAQQVETPSWAFGNSGTRFAVFAQPGALSAALGWYRALPWSGRDPVGRVRVPTLHVWSTGDTFLGRSATEATADFCRTDYRLEVLDDVSHWIPELAADRVAALVTAHVRTA